MAAVEESQEKLSQKIRIEERIKDIYSRLEDLTFKAIFDGHVQMRQFRLLLPTSRPVYVVTDRCARKLLGEIRRDLIALENELGGREIWKGITVSGSTYKLWGTAMSEGYSNGGVYHIPVGGIEVIVGATANYLALVNVTVEQGQREYLSVSPVIIIIVYPLATVFIDE